MKYIIQEEGQNDVVIDADSARDALEIRGEALKRDCEDGDVVDVTVISEDGKQWSGSIEIEHVVEAWVHCVAKRAS